MILLLVINHELIDKDAKVEINIGTIRMDAQHAIKNEKIMFFTNGFRNKEEETLRFCAKEVNDKKSEEKSYLVINFITPSDKDILLRKNDLKFYSNIKTIDRMKKKYFEKHNIKENSAIYDLFKALMKSKKHRYAKLDFNERVEFIIAALSSNEAELKDKDIIKKFYTVESKAHFLSLVSFIGYMLSGIMFLMIIVSYLEVIMESLRRSTTDPSCTVSFVVNLPPGLLISVLFIDFMFLVLSSSLFIYFHNQCKDVEQFTKPLGKLVDVKGLRLFDDASGSKLKHDGSTLNSLEKDQHTACVSNDKDPFKSSSSEVSAVVATPLSTVSFM